MLTELGQLSWRVPSVRSTFVKRLSEWIGPSRHPPRCPWSEDTGTQIHQPNGAISDHLCISRHTDPRRSGIHCCPRDPEVSFERVGEKWYAHIGEGSRCVCWLPRTELLTSNVAFCCRTASTRQKRSPKSRSLSTQGNGGIASGTKCRDVRNQMIGTRNPNRQMCSFLLFYGLCSVLGSIDVTSRSGEAVFGSMALAQEQTEEVFI